MARLLAGLLGRSEFAALGADSAGEMRCGLDHWDYPQHVGMAAIMFRRERLANLTFRWEASKCECLCCCEDLRRVRLAIGYLPGATAWHRPTHADTNTVGMPAILAENEDRGNGCSTTSPKCRILAAFNRRDVQKFRRQFLRTLRATGNHEPVTALAYGLYQSERDLLAALPGVEVVSIRDDNLSPAYRRVRDFQGIMAHGPVLLLLHTGMRHMSCFRTRQQLWRLVHTHPDTMLVVATCIQFIPKTPSGKIVDRRDPGPCRARRGV